MALLAHACKVSNTCYNYLNASGNLALCGGDALTLQTVSCKLTPVFNLLSL